jgi:hypothetical protein
MRSCGAAVLKTGVAEGMRRQPEITLDNLSNTHWWYQATGRDVKVAVWRGNLVIFHFFTCFGKYVADSVGSAR